MERRLSWNFLVKFYEKFQKCYIHRMKSRNWNMTGIDLVRFFVECLHDSQSCIQAMSDILCTVGFWDLEARGDGIICTVLKCLNL